MVSPWCRSPRKRMMRSDIPLAFLKRADVGLHWGAIELAKVPSEIQSMVTYLG